MYDELEAIREERVTVTRARALAIIKEHGWGPTTPTAIEQNGAGVEGSDFDSEMGILDTYLAADIFDWLGY
jgi:hypothetical protein